MKALKWQLLLLMPSKLSVHTKFYNFSRKFWQGVALSWTFLGARNFTGGRPPPWNRPWPPGSTPLAVCGFVKGVWAQRPLCGQHDDIQRLAVRGGAESDEHRQRRVDLLLAGRHAVPLLPTDGGCAWEPLRATWADADAHTGRTGVQRHVEIPVPSRTVLTVLHGTGTWTIDMTFELYELYFHLEFYELLT